MRITTCITLAIFAALTSLAGTQEDTTTALRVVSANVRYGTATDGDHAWLKRRSLLLNTLETARPDVLGLQEALDFQIEEIRARFPDHCVLGEGRDGGDRGEWCALLVDRTRFIVRGCGTFRLAPKDELGAIGWDAALTRIATWAELSDRSNGGQSVRVINVHFDHRGQQARAESAALIARWIEARMSMPTVVMGDLNAGETSVPLKTLNQAGFRDAYRDAHPDEQVIGTMHAFRGGRSGAKIDHILIDRSLATTDAWIDWTEEADRYPSDHRFVGAALRFASEDR